MSAHVTVVGAVNVDLVVSTHRLPGPGETVVGPRVVRSGGGKGANAAVAAAATGARTSLVAAVGSDDNGAFAVADLLARGVDITSVTTLADTATGCALIVVDAQGENQIAVGLGANDALQAQTVQAALEATPTDCVLISTEIPGACVLAAVRSAVRRGVPCVLNPAPVLAEVVELLDDGGVDRDADGMGVVLTPNAGEARDLARALGLQVEDPGEIAELLSARTGHAVVVTLGAGGTLVSEAGRPHQRYAAVIADRVVDTTGAGDCFNGSFAATLARGGTILDSVRTGMQAASASVRWAGARTPVSAT